MEAFMTTETMPIAQTHLGEAREGVGSGFLNVVIAADHPRHAALRAAMKVAIPRRTRFILVNVIEAPITMVLEGEDISAFYDGMRGTAENVLKEARKALPSDATVISVVREGYPDLQIAAVAKEFEADLIVMGTHRREARHFVLGSTSQSILRHAICPVLCVADVDEEPGKTTAHAK
jgi:nucleotide-binding universal stress UspA family protein